MPLELGYLLPTRERIMVGKHETGDIIALGDLADQLGIDSVWIGDSLLAKPRHDPLTLIAAIAARTADRSFPGAPPRRAPSGCRESPVDELGGMRVRGGFVDKG